MEYRIDGTRPPSLNYASPAAATRKFPWVPTIIAGIIIAAIFLPDFLQPCCRSRETANRVKCAANIRMLGNAVLFYAQSHQGQFPDSIETLLQAQPVDESYMELLICPTTNDEARADADRKLAIEKVYSRGQPSQFALSQTRPWLHISYVYAGRGMSAQTAPDAIVLYETISNHDEDGMNVLFADGHVDWFIKRQAVKMIAEVQAGHNPPRAEMLR